MRVGGGREPASVVALAVRSATDALGLPTMLERRALDAGAAPANGALSFAASVASGSSSSSATSTGGSDTSAATRACVRRSTPMQGEGE